MMASEFGSESAFLVVRVIANDGLPYVDKVEIVPDPNIIWPDRFYAVVYQEKAVTYEEARKKIVYAISILDMLKWARPWFNEGPEAHATLTWLRAAVKNTGELMTSISRLASVVFKYKSKPVAASALVIEKKLLDEATESIRFVTDTLASEGTGLY